MLALITQSKMPRPWLQLGIGSANHMSAFTAINDSLAAVPPLRIPEFKAADKSSCSGIPRGPSRSQPKRGTVEALDTVVPYFLGQVTQAERNAIANGGDAPSAAVASAPVVQSTRTRRFRYHFSRDYAEWPVSSKANNSDNLDQAASEVQRLVVCPKRQMCLIEELAQPSPSVIELPKDPFKQQEQVQEKKQQRQVQVHVPRQLTDCSPTCQPTWKLLKEPLCLDTITSQKLQGLFMWMEEYCRWDWRKLQEAGARSWNEQMLNLQSMLQHLFAAYSRSRRPFVERAMVKWKEATNDASCSSKTIASTIPCAPQECGHYLIPFKLELKQLRR
ncbi:hypothetical protein KR222_004607 [Zaprionus bogoriensis]|nr:hypothetical protein KR222_004607 [Zaprionus bogoriensis]